MSESDIKNAESDLDRSTKEFDDAIDHLRDSLNSGLKNVQDSVGSLMKSLQEKPITLWLGVFVSGYVLGTMVSSRYFEHRARQPGTSGGKFLRNVH